MNGGWTQQDEANPYYVDKIDQAMLDRRFLLEQFNYVLRTGWQIGPFDHSASQPMLPGAEVGFYFSRIHHQDVDQRRSERTAEMACSPSESLGGSSALLTGVFVCGSYGDSALARICVACAYADAHVSRQGPLVGRPPVQWDDPVMETTLA